MKEKRFSIVCYSFSMKKILTWCLVGYVLIGASFGIFVMRQGHSSYVCTDDNNSGGGSLLSDWPENPDPSRCKNAKSFGVLASEIAYFVVLWPGIIVSNALDVPLLEPSWWFGSGETEVEGVACTMDAMLCSDGSYVGRTGPRCEFVCPAAPAVPDDVRAHIDAKADLITLASPVPNAVVPHSPLYLTGEARGNWYFEASFPIVLVNWDGLIIAEGYATAMGDWMTEAFVPFTALLEFENPYTEGDPDFMKRGSLILQKDNPSGLPEHDDALEIPIRFAQ